MADHPSSVAPPPLALASLELARAAAEFYTLPFAAPILWCAPRGDGHPVIMLPGFTAGDGSTAVLRHYLKSLGHDVHGWELGRNLDHWSIGRGGKRLASRIETVRKASGRKVSLVGWSLGGMLAREAARRDPDSVRQVISLGSLLTGDPRSTNIWRLFEWLTGQQIDPAAMARRLETGRIPPPVPSTAIYSKTDGVVAWQNCIEVTGALTDNIEVCGSHYGLGVNPAVLYAVADRLAQPEGEWKPFERTGWRAFVYPSSGHVR